MADLNAFPDDVRGQVLRATHEPESKPLPTWLTSGKRSTSKVRSRILHDLGLKRMDSVARGFEVASWTAKVIPMGAPRQTQRDRWAKRPVVLRYHDFRDDLRASIPENIRPRLDQVRRLDWIAYIPIPPSYSNKRMAELAGRPCESKPDRDNLDKAILDALFAEDRHITAGSIAKVWDDGKGPRIEITIHIPISA